MPTTITPMRDFVSLREALDKLFEDSFIKPPVLNGGSTFPIDLYETPETYVLKASLPGVKAEDLSVDATSEIVDAWTRAQRLYRFWLAHDGDRLTRTGELTA